MTNKHETAEMAYARTSTAAQEKASKLLALLQKNAAEKNYRNWGEVGTMNHVVELLDELLEAYDR